MGSQQVTKGDAALASSITLAILKRTDAPVLVTKPTTPCPMGSLSGGLRAMLAVEHTARPPLKWLNTHLITVTRGDKLYLARVGAKDAKAQVCYCTFAEADCPGIGHPSVGCMALFGLIYTAVLSYIWASGINWASCRVTEHVRLG